MNRQLLETLFEEAQKGNAQAKLRVMAQAKNLGVGVSRSELENFLKDPAKKQQLFERFESDQRLRSKPGQHDSNSAIRRGGRFDLNGDGIDDRKQLTHAQLHASRLDRNRDGTPEGSNRQRYAHLDAMRRPKPPSPYDE